MSRILKVFLVFYLIFLALYLIFIYPEQIQTQPSVKLYNLPEEGKIREEKFIKVQINDKEFLLEVADEPKEWEKGLSGRVNLEGDGMIFIFPESDYYGFWMKDMRFSLDFVWVGESGVIVDITENVSPETFPKVFYPSKPVKYVIEFPAGYVQKYKLTQGMRILFLGYR